MFNRSSILLLLTAIVQSAALSGCAGSYTLTELTPTSDPVTRLVRSEPNAVLQAGAATLREMGFRIDDPAPGAVRVFSEPIVVQSSWRNAAIADRIICGVGLSAPNDANRTAQLANTIPISLRLGYEVEPRPDVTATTIIFTAEGRRAETVVPTSPTMACTLTVPFVNELFRELQATLQE